MGFRPQKLKEVEFYGLYTIENSKKLNFMGFRPQKLKEVEFYGLQTIETKEETQTKKLNFVGLDHRNSKKLNFMGFRPYETQRS